MDPVRREEGQVAVRQGGYHATDPLRCGVVRYESPDSGEYRTPQYALVYLSAGRARFESEGQSFTLKAGDLFQRFPDRLHRVSYEAETATHFLAVPGAVHRMMTELGLQEAGTPVLRLGTRHRFVERHAALVSELREAAPHQLMGVLTRMQELIVDMLFHAQAQRRGERHRRKVEEACLRLAADLGEPLSGADLASELGMGYSLFRRVFRESTGMAPQAYRIQRRIERAQELILEGRRITAIAKLLGYPDLYSFSAQFKKFTGLSPRAYARSRGG